MLFKELGIVPSFGPIEPRPCEQQREILCWGLAFMDTLESLKMGASRMIRTDKINALTVEELLGDMTPHDRASEKMLAVSRGIDPSMHMHNLAEKKRAGMLRSLEREFSGETDEEES